jgi:hypothetical protein
VRNKARIVKRGISKHNARGPNIGCATYISAAGIDMPTAAT